MNPPGTCGMGCGFGSHTLSKAKVDKKNKSVKKRRSSAIRKIFKNARLARRVSFGSGYGQGSPSTLLEAAGPYSNFGTLSHRKSHKKSHRKSHKKSHRKSHKKSHKKSHRRFGCGSGMCGYGYGSKNFGRRFGEEGANAPYFGNQEPVNIPSEWWAPVTNGVTQLPPYEKNL